MGQQISQSAEWSARCAQRVRELDDHLSEAEALEIAADLGAFERTARMEPEAAADFLQAEMNRPELPRFERRVAGPRDSTATPD